MAEEPAHKPALEADLDCSRSTIDRAIRRLESAGFVERTGEGYATTVTGRVAAENYRTYVAHQRAVDEATPVLSVLPPDCDLPPELLAGGSVDPADGDPHRAFERVGRALRDAERYRGVLPCLADSRHLRLLHARVVEDGLDADLAVAPDLADRLREEFPGLVAGLLDAPSCALRRAETPPYGLVVTDGDEGTAALLATYDEGTLAGTVENDAPAAIDRAREAVTAAVGGGSDVDPPDDRGDPGTTLIADRTARRRALTAAGVTRLDRTYFTERTPNDPETAWRLGFSLTDIYYGYAVDRADTDAGDPVADHSPDIDAAPAPTASALLADRLAGNPQVVIGPPGAGKTTLCRSVACRWVESGRGPVFYRDAAGAGGDLVEAIDAVTGGDRSGNALVVVEAATSAPEQFLELVGAARDDPSLTVLGEARERDWHETVDGMSEPRLREHARRDLATYRPPAVDERTCRRAVAAFERVTGREVPLSPSELHDRVENEGGVGEMHVLSYQIVAHAASAPWLDDPVGPSVLDEDVRAAYEALAPAARDDETLPMEVALLVATLTAAEEPVTPGILHAVAAARGADERTDRAHRRVEAVIEELDGRMLVVADDQRRYRTQHRQWATRFLERALDRAERETVALFERATNAVLSVADDEKRRRQTERWLGRESPAVRRFADGEAVDEFVETLFGLAFTRSSLAPLVGTTEHSGLDLSVCSPATRLEAISCRGKTWYDAGDPDRGEAELSTLCERAADVDVDAETRATYLAEGYRGLGEVVVDRGETEAAREHLERSLDAARDASPRHEVGAHNSLAWVAMTVDEYDRAESRLETALSVAEGIGPCGDHSDALYYRARLEQFRGDLAAAEEWLAETVEMDRAVGNEQNVSSSLKLRGDIAKERGDHERAARLYRRSVELKRDVRDRQGMAQTLFDFADLRLERGDHEAAETAFERSLEIARENDMTRHEGRVRGGLGRLAVERGDLGAAERQFRTQRQVHDDLNHRRGVAAADAGLGDVAVERGDYERARESYRESVATYRAIDDVRRRAEVTEKLADACRAAGDESAAAEWLATGREFAEAAGLDEWTTTFADRGDDLGAVEAGETPDE
ncbi:hypothetical protein BRD18_06125 [Halobacteriales archaeon SW_7_71_33]|nr:MAG: hypothetical protein BRD18_06125 [Halobacteriales archaeon SW_7_71_33]